MILRPATMYENASGHSPPAPAGGGRAVVGVRARIRTRHPLTPSSIEEGTYLRTNALLNRGGDLFTEQVNQ
jgi:hypothetical protein